MIIQVYEIQTVIEAQRCVELGVDHVGSVILSPDKIEDPEIKSTIETVKRHGKLSSIIPLFNSTHDIIRAAKDLMPDILHLCEDLSLGIEKARDRQVEIKKRWPWLKIMRTLPLPQEVIDIVPYKNMIDLFSDTTDYFLIDTYMNVAPVSGFVGITGVSCDWGAAEMIVEYSPRPCILAGGLAPENVYEAIKTVRPYGVDSCTGTNKRGIDGSPIRFQKDFLRLERFIKEARKAFLEYED